MTRGFWFNEKTLFIDFLNDFKGQKLLEKYQRERKLIFNDFFISKSNSDYLIKINDFFYHFFFLHFSLPDHERKTNKFHPKLKFANSSDFYSGKEEI